MLGFKKKKSATLDHSPRKSSVDDTVGDVIEKQGVVDDFDFVQSDENVWATPEQSAELLQTTANASQHQSELGIKLEPVYVKPTFDFASLLGKTEEDLRIEFYKFQLAELLKKVGSFPDKSINSSKTAEEFLISSVNSGIKDFILSPLEFSVYKPIQRRQKLKGVKFWVLSDGLKGEGSFKGKLHAVKALSKSGADCVIYPFPVRAEGFSLLGDNKRRAGKTVKASRRPVVFALENAQTDGFAKTVRAIDGLKADAFMLCTDTLNLEVLTNAFEVLEKFKGNKKIYIKCFASCLEDLTLLARFKLDKIFTPFAGKIAKEICLQLGLND